MDPSHHNFPSASTLPPTAALNQTAAHPMHRKRMMMMHMTFYWGKNALILFTGWPGNSSGMYALALILVFALAVLVEWLSYSNLIKPGSKRVVSGMLQTILYAVRSGLAYMLMLAVMSFNGGVFVAAVLGHAVGFCFFGSRVFVKGSDKASDLYPMTC